jgi:hypothetical protein
MRSKRQSGLGRGCGKDAAQTYSCSAASLGIEMSQKQSMDLFLKVCRNFREVERKIQEESGSTVPLFRIGNWRDRVRTCFFTREAI